MGWFGDGVDGRISKAAVAGSRLERRGWFCPRMLRWYCPRCPKTAVAASRLGVVVGLVWEGFMVSG